MNEQQPGQPPQPNSAEWLAYQSWQAELQQAHQRAMLQYNQAAASAHHEASTQFHTLSGQIQSQTNEWLQNELAGLQNQFNENMANAPMAPAASDWDAYQAWKTALDAKRAQAEAELDARATGLRDQAANHIAERTEEVRQHIEAWERQQLDAAKAQYDAYMALTPERRAELAAIERKEQHDQAVATAKKIAKGTGLVAFLAAKGLWKMSAWALKPSNPNKTLAESLAERRLLDERDRQRRIDREMDEQRRRQRKLTNLAYRNHKEWDKRNRRTGNPWW